MFEAKTAKRYALPNGVTVRTQGTYNLVVVSAVVGRNRCALRNCSSGERRVDLELHRRTRPRCNAFRKLVTGSYDRELEGRFDGRVLQ